MDGKKDIFEAIYWSKFSYFFYRLNWIDRCSFVCANAIVLSLVTKSKDRVLNANKLPNLQMFHNVKNLSKVRIDRSDPNFYSFIIF